MASLLKRFFRIGKSEGHSLLDSMENPIKMASQGVRELKEDLNKSIASLAEVKSVAIRSKRDLEQNKNIASEYERKAMLLLQKVKDGELSEADADRLASEALSKRDDANKEVGRLTVDYDKYQKLIAQLEGNIQQLRSKISSWENELKTLKARSKVSQATAKLNKQLAQIDSNDTLALLEKMKTKVEEEEALAESYGEIAGADKTVDDEIDRVLSGGSKHQSLKDLKEKVGLN